MKKVFLLVLMAALVPSLLWAQDDGDGRDRGRDRGDGYHEGRGGNRNNHRNNYRANVARPNNYHARAAAVSPQFRSMGVHSYPKPYARNKLLVVGAGRSSIAFPNRGPNGVAIHANVFARTNFSGNPVIRAHMGIITGAAFRANIVGFNVHENIVGNYYWHSYGGFNYCHYYDRWGYHWYGWYLGSNYFWTRWYSNNWWWYDPTYYRWCYWHDGGWWWQDPDTTSIYIYNNGNYSSANGSASPAPAGSAPQSNVKSADYFSTDSTREVRVLAGGDAFLYDISGNNAFKPIYMGSNVTDVKFSSGASLQIMLMFKDGSFAAFDRNGNSLSGGNGSSSSAPMNNGMDQGQSAPAPGQAPAPGSAPQPPPSGANPPSVPGSNT